MNAKILRLFIYSVAIFTALTFSSVGLTAPAFPTKPITIICYWTAGGSTDLTIRMIASRAAELLGQPVVVMNKTGGGGYVGMAEVFNASPDGYTLVVLSTSTMTVAPHLRKPPFEPWKMTPIMSYGVYPFTWAVRADAPWKTIKEHIEFIKKNPGVVKLATTGPDSMESLAMFMLKDQEKIDFKLVPYEGGAPGVAAVLGGHTDGIVSVAEAIPHIRDGSMRGLATFVSGRMAGLPDIPTLKELGYNVEVESRLSIYGPPGVPKDIVKKLEEIFKRAMDSEDFKRVCKTFEVTPSFLSSEAIDKNHRDLSVKFKTILIKIGRIKE